MGIILIFLILGGSIVAGWVHGIVQCFREDVEARRARLTSAQREEDKQNQYER